jgi:GNAT superfamily N-acetyltransferase
MMLPPGYELTEDRNRIDAVAAHAFLTESYWAKGRNLDTVRRSMAGSLVVAVYHDRQQIAMARAVTDYATFAYLQDVYVLEGHRGLGLSKVMIRHLLEHPRLQGVARWALFTKDAQPLYAQFGFFEYPTPERMMVRDAGLKPA